jgi:transposase, IS30 family
MEKKRYKQLTLAERIEIYRWRANGKSVRFIANQLGRSAATISRELRRNGKPSRRSRPVARINGGNIPAGGYEPDRADHRAQRRRHRSRGFLLGQDQDLADLVRQGLVTDRLSPEQIAGRLRVLNGRGVISYESIYRYVYHQWHTAKDPLYRALPQGRVKRRPHRARLSNLCAIQQRISIHDRPAAAADRRAHGHWEADLIQFSTYGQSVVVHERSSRFSLLLPQPRKTAADVAQTLHDFFAALPPDKRLTLTVDNGSEFYAHHRLHDLGLATYFCDPHSPWQKGGVEHAIKRFRRDLPRTTNPATLTSDHLQVLSDRHNHTPRKCLGFRTPAELFFNLQPVALTS